MKTQFNVPTDSIVEFGEILSENGLTNEIVGTTEDDELVVEVHYDKTEFDAVEELADLVEAENEDED